MMHRDFHDAGLRVFGIYPIKKDGKCGCENIHCKAAGKHPLISNWQHTPVWSDDQMDVMEMAGHFETGFGVLCSGLLVIDVDARNGGLASYAKLQALVPEIAGAGLIVETGSGGGSKHLYFKVADDLPLSGHLADYPGLDFKSSGYVVGPGSLHASGNRYRTVVGGPDDIDDAPKGLLELLARKDAHKAEVGGIMVDLSSDDFKAVVAAIPNDSADYETWIRVGMGIHYATQGGTDGFAQWVEWSAKSPKHDDTHMMHKWRSFGKNSGTPVTLGTLVHYAEAAGWQMPVTFSPDGLLDLQYGTPEAKNDPVVIGDKRVTALPFDISGVDLNRPPGFVGHVAAWIEGQSRRPRETIAVAAALQAIGNIAGLRWTDDSGDTTTNLFTFCVAGSRTGKEAIQQSIQIIHDVAGLGRCQHGAIKSEQEIVRNLIDHQPAMYVIDEFGLFLAKVQNAQKRGGASYLDGVIGVLMSAYSKASGKMLLTGDTRRELTEKYKARIARLYKQADDGGGMGAKAELEAKAAEQALNRLSGGLERPFLSLIGFTTPITFDGMVDEYSATNGFIGRSLIFREKETAPRRKRAHARPDMNEAMRSTILTLANGGFYSLEAVERIEHYEDRSRVQTTTEAGEMLEACADWLEDLSDDLKGRNGLESLSLGAYELIAKVSLILAVPSGVRTPEHVRWAFALVRADIQTKIRMVNITTAAADGDKANEIASKVLDVCQGDTWTPFSVVERRSSRKPALRETLTKVLDTLCEKGKLESRVKRHPTNGVESKEYRLKGH